MNRRGSIVFLSSAFALCLAAGVVSERLLSGKPALAQSSGSHLEVHLTDKGKQRVQVTNGIISTVPDKIDYKETYVVVTSRDTDRRTWILTVDDIKVIIPDR